MRYFLSVCIVLVTLTAVGFGQQTCPAAPPTECYFEGAATLNPGQASNNAYFAIGGLFDVSEKGQTAQSCGTALSQMGITNVLAFFWGIERYARTIVNTGRVSVGAVAFDSCMRPDQTIENMLGFAQCNKLVQGISKENLVAYVGPYENVDAVRSGMLAADLPITMVSPTANALGLSATSQRTLLRLMPSFDWELKAIVGFLNTMQAKFVIILYSSQDQFWNHVYERMQELIEPTEICVQYTKDYDNTPMNVLLPDLAARTQAKYIVPLMSKSKLEVVMSNISASINQQSNTFTFILTSMIGRDAQFLQSKSSTGNNTVVIDFPTTNQDMSDFMTYINNIGRNASRGSLPLVNNPWLATYLTQNALPNLASAPSPLRRSVMNTLASVNGILTGLDSAIRNQCGQGNNYQFCDQLRNQASRSNFIYDSIRRALGLSTDNAPMMQNSRFSYYVFIIDNSVQISNTFLEVGTYNNGGNELTELTVNLKDFSQFRNAFSDPVCPLPNQNACCEPPTTPIPPTTSTTPMVTTPAGNNNNQENREQKYVMVSYPTGQAITGFFRDESRPDEEYGTRFDLNHKWIIALGVLAGLGILSVIIFEIYILYKLLGTRVGSKWRTMWLGQLLLFGIFLCYLVLFAYLPIPTEATCGITRFGVGVSYAICFAVLLVKLMVILTSKPSDVLLPGDVESPNYLKGIYQFLMFIFAVGVQVVIDVQWLITVPPEAVKVRSNAGEMVWICNHYTWEAGSEMNNTAAFVRTNFENHLMSLIYIMVMILITTVLALNAHGIITNHRESVFIGIAAGFSIPIWLAWGLVGGLNKDHDYAHEFGDACIAFGLLLTATLILFAMFLPKVRQLVNMGVEGIYLEDDRDTYYAGSVIMAPPSYKSKGPNSVIYLNNQGIYSEPVVIGNGDPMATHLKHPGSTYSAPAYIKRPDSTYGGSTRVLRVTDDLRGHPPKKRSQSEVAYGSSGRPRSTKGTLPRSRSQTNLGAL